jgi:hypothetical protein
VEFTTEDTESTEKAVSQIAETIPQRLKPEPLCVAYGMAEAVPLQDIDFPGRWKAMSEFSRPGHGMD